MNKEYKFEIAFWKNKGSIFTNLFSAYLLYFLATTNGIIDTSQVLTLW